MKRRELNNWMKQPRKFFGGILTASMIFFGAAACNSGGGEEAAVEDEVAVTEEVGYDAGIEFHFF